MIGVLKKQNDYFFNGSISYLFVGFSICVFFYFKADQEDPSVKGKSGTITKLTLASYSVTSNQTTDNSSQTATGKGVKNL